MEQVIREHSLNQEPLGLIQENQAGSRIGLIHFRVGETDGVSLEMEKWKTVLERAGHQVFYLAGSGGSIVDYIQIKGLHYQHPINQKIIEVVYQKRESATTELEIKMLLDQYTESIKQELVAAIEHYQIEVVIPNNILSLGWNIAAGLAMIEAIKETGVRVIGHHHDFYWERPLYANPKYNWVKTLLEQNFPPRIEKMQHVVINRLACRELAQRGIEADIVPNVFDFQTEAWSQDEYNRDLKQALGLAENEIVFLQATRIVARKGIELMIDYIAHFNRQLTMRQKQRLYDGREITEQTKAVLVLVGRNEDSEYYQRLVTYAAAQGVRLIDYSEFFEHQRKQVNQQKIYSFWDAYQLADIVSYPSLLEGFGNQLLEAIYGKKPVLVYEYPVYVEELKDYQFQIISLGQTHQMVDGLAKISDQAIKTAVLQGIELLTDRQKYEAQVTENYRIGHAHFSYQTLAITLENLLTKLER